MTDGRAFKYRAFISYSHADSKSARRLHRNLERYRIPRKLRQGQAQGQGTGTGQEQATLGTVFLDKSDLSASSGLKRSITEALRASENLIVLCSPDAAKSKWVEEEITYFKSLGRADRIFTAILSGEPHAAANGFDAALECLPRAVSAGAPADGSLRADQDDEPLAADLRPQADGEKVGTLKLISGLLDIGLDTILQRQLTRARQKFMGLSVGAFSVVAVLTGLTWTAVTAQKEAEARRADAENFVEFLLSDLSTELEKTGRLDVLDTVGQQTISYYSQFGEADLDPNTNARRARSFQFMGELKHDLAETENSRMYFEEAYALTEAAHLADPDNPDRLFEHTRSAYLRTLPVRRVGDVEKELGLMQAYEGLAERLRRLDGKSERSAAELANAKMNLGRVRMRRGEFGPAKQNFAEADAMFEEMMAANGSVENLLALSENMAWTADAFLKEKDYKTHYDIRVAQTDLLEEGLRNSPADFRLRGEVVYAKLGLGNAARHSGQFAKAKSQLEDALRQTDAALRLEPNREKMWRAKSAVLLSLMVLAESQGDSESYRSAKAGLISVMDNHVPLVAAKNIYWDEVLPEAVTAMDESFTPTP